MHEAVRRVRASLHVILYSFYSRLLLRVGFGVVPGPLDQPVKDRKQRAGFLREPILYPRRDLGVQRAVNQPERFEFVQRRGEHSFGDVPRSGAPKFAEAQCAVLFQCQQGKQCPAAADLLDKAAGRG